MQWYRLDPGGMPTRPEAGSNSTTQWDEAPEVTAMVCPICGEVIATEIAQDAIANYVQHRLVRHHIGNDLAAGIGQGVGLVVVGFAVSTLWPTLKKVL